MVIQQIFDTVNLILNKQRRGFVKTSQKVIAVKAAMYDFFHGQLEIYRKTGYLPASLKPLTKPADLSLTAGGIVDLPADFVQEVTFQTSCGKEGTFLSPEEFNDRISSSILDPDQAHPIAKVINSKMYIAPDEYNAVNITYIRNPVAFVYATSVSGDGRTESFNAGGSTDMEFGYEHSSEIARLALIYLGVAFQNAEALQLAMSTNQPAQQ